MSAWLEFLTGIGDEMIDAMRAISHGQFGLREVALLIYFVTCLAFPITLIITSMLVNR